jgi:hypothetical protein
MLPITRLTHQIIATLKVSPRPFERGGGMAKQWRIRPKGNASPAVKKIREKLYSRKAEMKPLTMKRIFRDILEVNLVLQIQSV